MFSMNEENLSDARANDGMVGVGELEIVPHIQEDEFEHEKISEEGDEMDDREELPAVTAVEPPVVNSECGENEESGSDGSDSDSSGSDSSDSSGNGNEGGDNERSGNEKNDE
ncbi:hypothetical protein YC2023_060617 [Brassica napus]